MKKIALALSLALCLTALGGCAFRRVDELYTLPKLPGDYQNLQAKIEEVTTGTGAEYSAPLRGDNTQPVQFQDLDGDGTLEALAFFKVTGEEKPLKIYIFRLMEDGYEVGAVVEGEGSDISSVTYENLNSTPSKELVVSWQKTKDVYALAVCSVDQYEVSELLNTSYTAYSLVDIDMDNQRELLVINVGTAEGNSSQVDCYDADKTSLVPVGTAPLSKGITSRDVEPQGHYLKGTTPIPALYVTAALGEDVVTDIFAWKDGVFRNVTLNAETGVSSATTRAKDKAKPADINGDSVLEVPAPIGQPGGAADAPTLDAWYQYDINGNASLVYITYHDFVDNWYLTLPDDWVGTVTVTTDTAVIGEKRTIFGRWTPERSEPFLTIYKLTGANRHMRAHLGHRFSLTADDTTIYCAEFTGDGWDCGLDEAAVKDHFKLSQTDWTTG